jgi:hypothetical protein
MEKLTLTIARQAFLGLPALAIDMWPVCFCPLGH